MEREAKQERGVVPFEVCAAAGSRGFVPQTDAAGQAAIATTTPLASECATQQLST